MGARGPVGKRSSARMGHRSKAEKEAVSQVAVNAPLTEQPPPNEHWHPLARDWYVSLAASGQSVFFEPTDWQAAHVVAGMITNLMEADRPSGQLFTSVWSAMNDLMTTEGARRRLKLELERTGGSKAAAQNADAVATIDSYRKQIAG